MANYTTTEAATWIAQVWEPGIEVAAYNEAKIWQLAKRLKAIGGQVHIRKHANLARQTLTNGTAGFNINPVANTEVEVTAFPTTIFVYTAINDNVIARMMFDPEDTLRQSIEMSIGEGVDIQAALLATDFVSNVVGGPSQDVDEATTRVMIKKLAKSAKQYFKVGETEPAFIVAPDQIDKIMGDPLFTQFQMRGDGTSPLVKGWVIRAHGAAFYESGTIQQSSSMFRNMLLLPRKSIAIGFNKPVSVKMQDFLLEQRLIGWTDVCTVTQWEEYSARFDTTVS